MYSAAVQMRQQCAARAADRSDATCREQANGNVQETPPSTKKYETRTPTTKDDEGTLEIM